MSSSTANADSLPEVPKMGAEGGFEVDETVPPLRISGFLCLLFGLLSVLSLITFPMIAMPIIAIAFGLFALRSYEGPKPVGLTLAKIGLVLAVGLGACGFSVHKFKQSTLANQAEYFARQYLQVIGTGEFAVALELKKDVINRLPMHMPLDEHYNSTEELKKSLSEFADEGLNKEIHELGPDTKWVLLKKPYVFQKYGTDQAEMVFTNPESKDPKKVYVLLKFEIDKQGILQWRVDQLRIDMERLVAESIL